MVLVGTEDADEVKAALDQLLARKYFAQVGAKSFEPLKWGQGTPLRNCTAATTQAPYRSALLPEKNGP